MTFAMTPNKPEMNPRLKKNNPHGSKPYSRYGLVLEVFQSEPEAPKPAPPQPKEHPTEQ